MSHVLDASAVLALLNGEPGAERVSAVLDEALISAVNAIEVGTTLTDSGMDSEAAWTAFELLGIPVVDLDAPLSLSAISLRTATKHAGLSLADRACLALALREGAPAVTTDRAWANLDLPCAVELIR